jgi:hypothetical protein
LLTENADAHHFSHTGPVGGLSDATLQGFFSTPRGSITRDRQRTFN